MADTVRLTNLKFVLATLQALDLAGPRDAEPTYFSVAVPGPIGDLENRKRYAVGVVAGKEITRVLYPITECQLEVSVEWRMSWNTGDQYPEYEAERVLGLIKKALAQDRTLGGNAIDFRETGNDIVLDLYTDKTIVGCIYYELLYRHQTLDPTLAV